METVVDTLTPWQEFDRLITTIGQETGRLFKSEHFLQEVSGLFEASGASLNLFQQGQSVNKHWGSLTGEKQEWPLPGAGEGSCLELYGLPPASETDRLRREIIVKLCDAALGAENKIRAEHARRRLQESLLEISHALNSSLDLEEVMAVIMDRVAMLVPYNSANVMLLEDDILVMHAAHGYQDLSGPQDLTQITFVPSRTYLMTEVLYGAEPVIVADTATVPDWVWVPCGQHIRSWMGVPLRVKGQPIGLFSIDKAVPNFFTAQQAELAMALATHAALALENARLFNDVRDAQAQLAGLSAQVIQAQEQERQKIAVELHDHSGQALLGLRAELQALKHFLPPDSHQALEQIAYLDQIVYSLSQDLRQLAHDLHPPMLFEMGLAPAVEQFLDEFGRRMAIAITFDFQHERQMKRLPRKIELNLYRILQEALTNLAKHAQASKVKVKLCLESQQVLLSIADDGVGISPQLRKSSPGFGLIGIRQRVRSLGGSLAISSQPGWGTQLVVEIPLQADDQHG